MGSVTELSLKFKKKFYKMSLLQLFKKVASLQYIGCNFTYNSKEDLYCAKSILCQWMSMPRFPKDHEIINENRFNLRFLCDEVCLEVRKKSLMFFYVFWFFLFFSIIITMYIDSLVTNILKIKVNKTRQHRTQNLQKTYTAYCKFCT